MLALRLATLAILGLSVAWWLAEPGYEPVIAAIATIAGLLSAEAVTAARHGRKGRATPAGRGGSREPLAGSPLKFVETPHTVGRRDVLDRLRGELARLFQERAGRLVCVTGEAGIGKTTVAENFLSELSSEDVTIARGRCSERLAGAEAYLPLLEALESILRGPRGDEFSDLMVRTAPTWCAQLAPLFESVAGDGSEGPVSQDRFKREIARFLEQLTRDRPLVLFLEDLHWADLSTVDVLTYLADRFDGIAALVLTTYRPEDMRVSDHGFYRVRPTLEQRGLLTEIPLRFLQPEDVERYLALEFPGHSFPDEFADAIHERTEGSPLFMVSLLRYLRDQGGVARASDSWVLTRPVSDVVAELPRTLASTIDRKMARLDELGLQLLGVAAVQGYEFHAVVVAESLNLDVAAVEERLIALDHDHALIERVDDEVLPDGTLTARYEFVHVLYQHALFESVAPTRRIIRSRQVAQALVSHYGAENPSIAAELAVLYEGAREFERAAANLQIAARQALRLSAANEAVTLSRKALGLLESVAPGTDRDSLELGLLVTLGNALSLTEGWGGAPEVTETYVRARELAERTGQFSELHPLLIQGLFYRWTRRDIPELMALIEDQRAIARRTEDRAVRMHVPWMDAALEFWRGRVHAARPLFAEAMAAYEPGQDGARFVYGYDPGIACQSYASWNLLLCGYADQARSLAEDCREEAERLDHPFTTVYGLIITTWVSVLLRDSREALRLADRTIELADQHELPFYGAYAGMQRAWALAHEVGVDVGLREMTEQLDRYRAIGSVLSITSFLTLLADMHIMARQPDEARSVIQEALKTEVEIEEFTFDAELHRLRGEVLRLDRRDAEEVERCYRTAIETARNQESRWFELRAATSLGRFLSDDGRPAEALDALQATYSWFTEGGDTFDLREAKHLLDVLGR